MSNAPTRIIANTGELDSDSPVQVAGGQYANADAVGRAGLRRLIARDNPVPRSRGTASVQSANAR